MAKKKSDNIKYILIDEYQDFSNLFYDLINTIRTKNPSISFFCVGDDWQAINGFAGSDLEFFDNFEKYFPGGRKISLLTNYRSYTRIVECSNLLMADQGEGGKPKENKLGTVCCFPLQRVEWIKNQELYQKEEKYRKGAQSIDSYQGKRMEVSRYLKTVEHIIYNNHDKEICLLFRTNEFYGAKILKFKEK